MYRAVLIALLLAAPLLASDAGFEIAAEAGIGKLTRAPYVPIRVYVRRSTTELQPFSGRVSVHVSRTSRTGMGNETSRYSTEFSMEAGRDSAVVLLNVPEAEHGFSGKVVLERAVGDGRFDQEAEAQVSSTPMRSDIKVVGFISTARLEVANPFSMDFALIEIPAQQLMGDWKSLIAYDAIIVNNEDLSREQNNALVEYVVAGGTLIISPHSDNAFSSGLPAAELLGVASNATSRIQKVADYGFLIPELKQTTDSAHTRLHQQAYYAGYGPGPRPPGRRVSKRPANTPANSPANGPVNPPTNSPDAPRDAGSSEGTPTVPDTPVTDLDKASLDATFKVFESAGRARPVSRTSNLISFARVGAGMVVFLHTDISAPPFVVSGTDPRPSLAGANLIFEAATQARVRGMGLTPLATLATPNGRQLVDIAGHRIPGIAAMILATALYIFGAAVGAFFLARKLRRPELYPACLVVLGVLSVLGVFGLGNWYKRSGDRVNSVRVIVSDGVSSRAGAFSLGCAYVPSGGDYVFKHGRSASLVPAEIEFGSSRGMPTDPMVCQTRLAGDITTGLNELSQWQNVVFVATEPVKRETLKFNVTGTESALTVENLSEFDLKGCIILVGGDTGSGGTPTQWHYLPRLGAASAADHIATLTKSTTQLNGPIALLVEKLDNDFGSGSYENRALMTLLRRTDHYRDGQPLRDIETSALMEMGINPAPGEVLVIAVLPPDALSVQSLGTPEEPADIRQACIWCVRCAIGER